MLNHVIVFSNKFLRLIFARLRLYKIRYSVLENKKNPVFIGVVEGFEFKTGIKNSTGEIIGFLNSDDNFYDENSLQHISDAFDDNTDCVFGDLIYTDKNENIKRVWKGSDFKKGAFQKGWMPAHPTFYCRRSIYEKFGLYNDTYKLAGDFELMLRFFEKHNIRSKYIPQTLVNMKIGGVNNSSIKSKMDILKEEFRAFKQNKISVNKLSYIFHKALKIKEFF